MKLLPVLLLSLTLSLGVACASEQPPAPTAVPTLSFDDAVETRVAEKAIEVEASAQIQATAVRKAINEAIASARARARVKATATATVKVKAVEFYNKGISYLDQADYLNAIEQFTGAIRLNREFTWAFQNIGIGYYALGQYELAIENYSKAIELDPGYRLAYVSRGHGYNTLRRYELAIENYSKAIELDPDDAFVYKYRGDMERSLKQYQSAIEDYSEAIRIDPEYVKAYQARGRTYTVYGDITSAEEDRAIYNKLILATADGVELATAQAQSTRQALPTPTPTPTPMPTPAPTPTPTPTPTPITTTLWGKHWSIHSADSYDNESFISDKFSNDGHWSIRWNVGDTTLIRVSIFQVSSGDPEESQEIGSILLNFYSGDTPRIGQQTVDKAGIFFVSIQVNGTGTFWITDP